MLLMQCLSRCFVVGQMSEPSDEYELSVKELPPMIESLDLRFNYGN